jgi:hypothetical protein
MSRLISFYLSNSPVYNTGKKKKNLIVFLLVFLVLVEFFFSAGDNFMFEGGVRRENHKNCYNKRNKTRARPGFIKTIVQLAPLINFWLF